MIAWKERNTTAHLGRALDGLRVHHWVYFALPLLLTSCVPVTDRVTPSPEERRAGPALPSGPPVASIEPHADLGGWTVTILQPTRRTVNIVRNLQEEYRYVYLNPITVPVGLLGCASGLWAMGFTVFAPTMSTQARQQLSEHALESCLMAVMINRSSSKHSQTKTLVEQREETETRPIAQGRITVEWQGPRPVVISYPIGSAGRTAIRLQHLETAIRHAGWSLETTDQKRIEVSFWQDHRQLARWPIQLSDIQLSAARHEQVILVPPRRWPTPMVVRVLVDEPPTSRLRLEPRFIRALLENGVSVVASEDAQRLLQQEIHSNLQGLVDDTGAVGPGHWLAANVLLIVRIDRSPPGIMVRSAMLNVQTREVLAQVETPAGPTEEAVAWDVAVLQTAELIRSAATPRKSNTMHPQH